MSCGNSTCNCSGKSGIFLAFVLLAASVAVLLGAMLKDALNIKAALAQQEISAKAQMEGQQGQQLVAAKNHYYALYSDLIALGQKDPEAAAIAQKYGIRINQQPAGAPAAPANR